PRGTVLGQQHGRRALAQQLPVVRCQQCLLQRVVRQVLLDHQSAALGAKCVDDGVGQVGAPRLGIAGCDPGGFQTGAQLCQQRLEVVPILACQQVQLGTDE